MTRYLALALLPLLLCCDRDYQQIGRGWWGCAPTAASDVLAELGYYVPPESLSRTMNTNQRGETRSYDIAPGIVAACPAVDAWLVEQDSAGLADVPCVVLLHESAHSYAALEPDTVPRERFAVVHVKEVAR